MSSSYHCSSQQLRNAATNATTIGNAIATNPVQQLSGGDLGHTGVAAALATFHSAWVGELKLRNNATEQASRLLAGAAADMEHLDALLAAAASLLGRDQ